MAHSERFEQALLFAVRLHADQTRKGSGTPYISHLFSVCGLVMEHGGNENQVIAALLHDAAEDQGGYETLETIRVQFGERVAVLVEALSDTLKTPKPPWLERKKNYVRHLPDADPESWLVSIADKVHNTRTILADHHLVGDEIWDRFKQGREGTLWYYKSLVETFKKIYPGYLADELERVVTELERLNSK